MDHHGGREAMGPEPAFLTSLLSGATAGVSVDIVLFPLDTLKTRLQSEEGFRKSGGFRHLYRGLGAVAIGSAPSAAVFFCVYDSSKKYLSPYTSDKYLPFLHMFAGALAEGACCLIRVPVEVVKQRQQASVRNLTGLAIVRDAYKAEGILGLFRGYRSTMLREIPFSIIQLPMWELLMREVRRVRKRDLNPLEVSFCGGLAGAIAATVTTPLDVAKTRIILANVEKTTKKDLGVATMLRTIYKERGVPGLFAGFVPRVLWITVGGSIFFGVYGATRDFLGTFTVRS